jgi:hypothetical protein
VDSSRYTEHGRELWHVDPVQVDTGDAPPASASPPSIGAYLASQRQLRGISREQLCNQTQIPLRSLERLETGVFDELDDGFVRGFVRTVAIALGLDPDDTLARMTREPTSPTDSTSVLSGSGLVRIGVLVLALSLILISVGLVGVAVQYVPGQNDASPLVMRSDPVRALAEAQGVSSFSATQTLVTPIPQSLPPATLGPEPFDFGRDPSSDFPSTLPGRSLRADARTLEP